MGILDFGELGKGKTSEEIKSLKLEIHRIKEGLKSSQEENERIQKRLADFQLSQKTFYSNIRILSHGKTPQEILEGFWKILIEFTDLIEVHLLGYDSVKDQFNFLFQKSPNPENFLKETLPNDGDNFVSWVFKNGMPLYPSSISSDPLIGSILGRGKIPRARLILPCLVEQKPTYFLAISSAKVKDLEEETRLQMIQFMLNMLSLSLNNSLLLERLDKENKLKIDKLAAYHSQEEMDSILSHSDQTEKIHAKGVNRDITVFFVDIRGFTALSETLDAPLVVRLLDIYLEVLTSEIIKNGGAIDKFIGDEIMALFGLKQVDGEGDLDLYTAIDAALAVLNLENSLNQRLNNEGLPQIKFGIGVHKGKAVIGSIGSEVRKDFTAIGDTVNTAARLCSHAPGGTVGVSEETAKKLNPYFLLKNLGEVTLKGKSKPTRLFQVLSPSPKFFRCPSCKLFNELGKAFCGYCGDRGDPGKSGPP